MKYLITGYDFAPEEIEADTPTELIQKFADYCGDDSELFEIAIKGCENDMLDLMQMFNHFGTYTITNIYEIAKKYSLDEVEE